MRSFSHYLPLSNSRGASIHVEDFQSSRIQFIIASVTQSSPVYLIFWQVQIRRFSLFQIEIHLPNCLIYSYNLYSVQHHTLKLACRYSHHALLHRRENLSSSPIFYSYFGPANPFFRAGDFSKSTCEESSLCLNTITR